MARNMFSRYAARFAQIVRFVNALKSFLQTYPLVYWAAWESTVLPIRAIINATDDQTRNDLISKWVNMLLSQLMNVELIGAILSAVIIGAFSGLKLDNMPPVALALLRYAWFSSLTCSIAAVGVALHESVWLARISIVPRANELIPALLSYTTSNGEYLPRQVIAFVFQLPVALLDCAIGFLVAGFVVYLWDVTKMGQEMQTTRDRVVASLFATEIFIIVTLSLISVATLWYRVARRKDLLTTN